MKSIQLEAIWWLSGSHHVPIDIIREVMTEWVPYEKITSLEQYNECLTIYFSLTKEIKEKRKQLILKYGPLSEWNQTNNYYGDRLIISDEFMQKLEKLIGEENDKCLAIESNEQFRECIRLWFDKQPQNKRQRQIMIDTYGTISKWKTINITDMSNAFSNRKSFNGNICKWNVSNVTNMKSMFENCTKFNRNLHRWDVGNVICMDKMFKNCINMNSECDFYYWNVSNVTSMKEMFSGCLQFNSLLSLWNISNVISMRRMFYNCKQYNQSLYRWDIATLDSFEMIKGCDNLIVDHYPIKYDIDGLPMNILTFDDEVVLSSLMNITKKTIYINYTLNIN